MTKFIEELELLYDKQFAGCFGNMDPLYKLGCIDTLKVLINEHKRYLDKKEPRSEIGPLFDAGLNTAAEAIMESCMERIKELENLRD